MKIIYDAMIDCDRDVNFWYECVSCFCCLLFLSEQVQVFIGALDTVVFLY